MKDVKFRAWNKVGNCYLNPSSVIECLRQQLHFNDGQPVPIGYNHHTLIFEQYLNLKDDSNPSREIYEGDIMEFDNGDKFYIIKEYWIEYSVFWIGNPECEDQARDLYRIERAKIIGNIQQNPDLIKEA